MNYNKFVIPCALILVLLWSRASLGAQTLESLLLKEILKGWTLIEGPRTYTKKTLFQHNDGHAELFFKYGYQKSVFGIYENREKGEDQIEVDVYDMENVLQAFGIFSRFRNGDRPGGMGLDSYFDDQSAFFYKGRYFVVLYATETDPSALKQLGLAISSKVPGNSIPPREIGYFPRDGLKPGSIQYFPDGLLGHQFLKRGFQAAYFKKVEVKAKIEEKIKDDTEFKTEDKGKDKVESNDKAKESKTDDKENHLFLAMFKNPEEAKSGLRAYKDYLTQRGKVDSRVPAQLGPDAVKGEDPYQGQVIIAHKGSYLLGVVGFQRLEEAEDRLAEFLKNMK